MPRKDVTKRRYFGYKAWVPLSGGVRVVLKVWRERSLRQRRQPGAKRLHCTLIGSSRIKPVFESFKSTKKIAREGL